MRKFRFIGNSSDYGDSFFVGSEYNEDHIGLGCSSSVLYYSMDYPEDWEEVLEEPILSTTSGFTSLGIKPTKPLHKDTDLGYFAGLIAQGVFSNPNHYNLESSDLCKWSILVAKELIKQLNEEQ